MDKHNIGDTISGIVTGIKPYGAFVSIEGGYTGLIHISEISEGFVRRIEDFITINEKVDLKILEIDETTKHMKLSLKSINDKRNQRKYMQFSKDYRKEIASYKQDFTVVGSIVNTALEEKNREKTIKGEYLFAKPLDWQQYQEDVTEIHNTMMRQVEMKEDGLGWVDYPNILSEKELTNIVRCAQDIRSRYNTFVICGIGGSYLGARAGIEMLSGLKKDNKIDVVYFGNSLSSFSANQMLEYLKGRDFIVNVISKSGTTLESAIGFRLLRNLLIQKYGEGNIQQRIIVTTDGDNGVLRLMAKERNYTCFSIPKDIGGRYSAFTNVGLLPFAVAGIDIYELIKGARKAYLDLQDSSLFTNEAYQYAVARFHQYQKGNRVELLVSYEPQMSMFAEWWKQLFAESEGKQGKGLFPAAIINTTDLHSLGQFIQDGSPILFETVIAITPMVKEVVIHESEDNFDGLNQLKNQTLTTINQLVLKGTIQAHQEQGKVDTILLHVNRYDAFGLGYLFYFFMRSCAMSCYLMGVNPFNQPGVEVYKQNLARLLGKK